MGNYSWIEIILILGAFQGFLLALALPNIAKTNKQANRILSILLFAVSLSIVVYLNSYMYQLWSARMQVFLDTLAFLYAPLLYLYYKRLLFPKKKESWTPLYFLPGLIHFIYGLSIFRYSDQTMQDLLKSGKFLIEWGLFFAALVILTLIFWLASLRLLLTFKKNKDNVRDKGKNLIFLTVFLVCLLFGDLISIAFGLHHFFGIEFLPFTDLFISWLLIPFLVYFITYQVITQPQVLNIEYLSQKTAKNRIPKGEVEKYKTKLEKAMSKQKLYLDPELSLVELAAILDMKPTKLSWLINTGFDCNFYDFVNSYRTIEFVEKLKNNEHQKQTLLSLAYDSGFNSKTTFNKAFKKRFQSTPSQFVQDLKIS